MGGVEDLTTHFVGSRLPVAGSLAVTDRIQSITDLRIDKWKKQFFQLKWIRIKTILLQAADNPIVNIEDPAAGITDTFLRRITKIKEIPAAKTFPIQIRFPDNKMVLVAD